MSMRVQVLMSPGCGHGQQTVELVRDVLDALAHDFRLETVVVQNQGDAERRRFPGSPTIRINGNDVDPDAPAGVGVG
jgi:glutaredoxin